MKQLMIAIFLEYEWEHSFEKHTWHRDDFANYMCYCTDQFTYLERL